MKRITLSRPYVYALVDPSGFVFYVGKGTGRRMFTHERDAARGKPGPRMDRIRAIVKAGGCVSYRVLGEYETGEDAARAEVEFIASFDGLCNLTKGGEIGGERKIDWRQRAIDGAKELLRRVQGAGNHDHEIVPVLLREIENPSIRSIEWSPERGVVVGWRSVYD